MVPSLLEKFNLWLKTFQKRKLQIQMVSLENSTKHLKTK